jgi:hypothetical protein
MSLEEPTQLRGDPPDRHRGKLKRTREKGSVREP